MNKIFKVIWNRTTQSLVVTSELAKGAVKASCENNNQENKTPLHKFNYYKTMSLPQNAQAETNPHYLTHA